MSGEQGKPLEPSGLGAVVRDGEQLWARVRVWRRESQCWYSTTDHRWAAWAEFSHPEILSRGYDGPDA